MEHNVLLRYKNLMLRQIEQADLELLRNWRNDKEKTKFLRKINHITPEMQEKWFNNYLNNKNELAFAIVETENIGALIGSVSLYNFKNNQAEIGKILIGNNQAKGFGYGRISFAMLMTYAFEKLNLKKIVATVNKNNIPARKSYFRLGFKVVGETITDGAGVEDVIEIDRKTFAANNAFYNEILMN